MEGLDLWEQVDRSDPDNLKKMKFGAKLTAIDAYSQIKRATEIFGPVGMGWGWEPSWQWHQEYVSCQCTLWYSKGEERYRFDVCGTAMCYDHNNKPNADAPKSALTDAITKGLSYLGFNADVFLGEFDGNKYVNHPADAKVAVHNRNRGTEQKPRDDEEVRETVRPTDNRSDVVELNRHPAQKTARRIIQDMKECTTRDELIMCWEREQDILSRMPKWISDDVIEAKEQQKHNIERSSVHN